MTLNRYTSFTDLARHTREGQDFRRLVQPRASGVAIVAPHGGGIEPGTSEIATVLAGHDFSLYRFEGLRRRGNEELHIASTDFDEPLCVRLVRRSRVVVAVHGCAGEAQVIYVGGLDHGLKAELIAALRRAGFDAEHDVSNHSGSYTCNVCNRGITGRGIQLELTRGLRRAMFQGLRQDQRAITTPAFDRLVAALRGVLGTWISGREPMGVCDRLVAPAG